MMAEWNAADMLRNHISELVAAGKFDSVYEFRTEGGIDSDVCPWSDRNYECDGKAVQIADGRWIGYPYWYGGGKHGEPGLLPWIDEAIWLESWTETIEVRKFRQKKLIRGRK